MESSLRNEVPPVVTGFLTYGFLVLGPFVFLLNAIREVPAVVLLPASVTFALLYVRTLLNTASRKLLSHKTKGRRNFKGLIDEEQLALLHDSLRTNTDRMNQDQVRYFALSILAPQMIRRRVTDEYTPGKRTLRLSE